MYEHDKLACVGAKWLAKKYKLKWVYVNARLSLCEQPDVFSYKGRVQSYLIEVKTSRSDFLRDKRKYSRQCEALGIKGQGIGNYKFYLCPDEMIKVSEIPEKWGLLYIKDGKITLVKDAIFQEKNSCHELEILSWLVRHPNLAQYRDLSDVERNLKYKSGGNWK